MSRNYSPTSKTVAGFDESRCIYKNKEAWEWHDLYTATLAKWHAEAERLKAKLATAKQEAWALVQREWIAMRRSVIEASLAAEILAGNSVKADHERHALAELQALEEWCRQQAEKELP